MSEVSFVFYIYQAIVRPEGVDDYQCLGVNTSIEQARIRPSVMIAKVSRVPLQPDKLAVILSAPDDYVDAFECLFDPPVQVDAREVALCFVSLRPGWFKALMKLRNILVKPFGPRTGSTKVNGNQSPVEEGGKLAFFEVLSADSHKVILYAEDKHLDSRLIIEANPDHWRVITSVHYRNGFGRAYMTVIKPFHLFIIKDFTKRVAEELTRSQPA
jgi:hypothetical protein